MGLDVGPIGSVGYTAPQQSAARISRPQGPQEPPAAVVDVIPAEPPPEVLDAIDVAARSWQQLQGQGREVRFALDAQSGGLSIEVRGRDGDLLHTIAPSKLLDVATGGNPE